MKGKSICKKILGVLALGLLVSPFAGTPLLSVQQVHAQSTETTTPTVEDKKENMIGNINEILDSILKIIYILLWPLLFVAGLALDNSLVYGSIFNLDVPLWKFWNMMKNFANFALGFMVLFSILKSIFGGYFGGGGNDKRSPQKIIKSTLLAGVLIQSSWFLFGAIIDISTIATYAVGGLPLTLVKGTATGDFPIIGNSCTMNLGEYTSTSIKDMKKMDCYCTYGDKKVSQCRYAEIGKEFYIVGREQVGPGFQPGYCCSAGGIIQKINEFPDLVSITDQSTYDTAIQEILGNVAYQEAWKECRYIRKAFGLTPDGNKCSETIGAVMGPQPDLIYTDWLNVPTPNIGSSFSFQGKDDSFFTTTPGGLTVSSVLESSKGFVGPMVTIYSSLLDFASITDTDDNANLNWGKSLSFIIKVLFAVMLFFPLAALAIVLLARIAYLWLAIALSPLLLLKEVFFKDKKMDGKMMEQFSLPNLIKLIFAPVFVVFALSIGLIFMSTMQSMKTAGVGNNELLENFGIEQNVTNERSFSFFGIFEFEYEGELIDKGLDNFSWLILNLFSIGLLWFLLFRAIKQNSIGEKVGKTIQDFGQGVFGNVPIVPIAGGVGINAAKEVVNDRLGGFSERMTENEMKNVREEMPRLYGNQGSTSVGASGYTDAQIQEILKQMREEGKSYEEATKKYKFEQGYTSTSVGQQDYKKLLTAIEGSLQGSPAEQQQQFDDILNKIGNDEMRNKIKGFSDYKNDMLTGGTTMKKAKITDLEKELSNTALIPNHQYAMDILNIVGNEFKDDDGITYIVTPPASGSTDYTIKEKTP